MTYPSAPRCSASKQMDLVVIHGQDYYTQCREDCFCFSKYFYAPHVRQHEVERSMSGFIAVSCDSVSEPLPAHRQPRCPSPFDQTRIPCLTACGRRSRKIVIISSLLAVSRVMKRERHRDRCPFSGSRVEQKKLLLKVYCVSLMIDNPEETDNEGLAASKPRPHPRS